MSFNGQGQNHLKAKIRVYKDQGQNYLTITVGHL